MKVIWAFLVSGMACAQTQIDLRTQAKDVDFSGFPFTKPIQVGTAPNPTCGIGTVFFNKAAPPGSNIYGCYAANLWVIEGSTTVGTTEGTLVPGAGILLATSNVGGVLTIQVLIDSSVVQLISQTQSGNNVLCKTSSGSASAYTCSMGSTLSAYSFGQVLNWIPDVNCTTSATLNIDALGAAPITHKDSTPVQSADCIAGELHQIWFDGINFRVMN